MNIVSTFRLGAPSTITGVAARMLVLVACIAAQPAGADVAQDGQPGQVAPADEDAAPRRGIDRVAGDQHRSRSPAQADRVARRLEYGVVHHD